MRNLYCGQDISGRQPMLSTRALIFFRANLPPILLRVEMTITDVISN